MVHSELVAALCTALTFACAVQIIITCFLAFAFSQFMGLLYCHIPTAAGVLSGLVTVPTVIQLRAAQISHRVDRKYGYTIWYKRLAIGICAILQIITWILTIVKLCTNYDNDSFLKDMKCYNTKQTCKSIVDNIQWFLQCCGAKTYEDWFNLDWGGFIFDTFQSRRKKSIKELLFEDTDQYPDLTVMRSDTVPFSCCSETAKTACIHQNLQQLGTFTINESGCTSRLASTKQSILWTEFVIYTVCLFIELTILVLLKSSTDKSENLETVRSNKCFHSTEEKQYSEFLNVATLHSKPPTETRGFTGSETTKTKSGSTVTIM